MKRRTCHRLKCDGEPKIGIRDQSGMVLMFCKECFRILVRDGIIDRTTGQILTS